MQRGKTAILTRLDCPAQNINGSGKVKGICVSCFFVVYDKTINVTRMGKSALCGNQTSGKDRVKSFFFKGSDQRIALRLLWQPEGVKMLILGAEKTL